MRYIVANWKMNMDLKNVKKWLGNFEQRKFNNKVILSPSFPFLHLLQTLLEGSSIELAAQNFSDKQKGAYTGEVGLFQIKEFCKYCIVGHSETKEGFDTISRKRDLCLKESVTPIVCFTDPKDALKYYAKGSVLAWEDPQNISHDGVFNEKPAQEVGRVLSEIKEKLPPETAVLYGGSVHEQNVAELAKISGLGGVISGGASLDPKRFERIINGFEQK